MAENWRDYSVTLAIVGTGLFGLQVIEPVIGLVRSKVTLPGLKAITVPLGPCRYSWR